MKIQRFLLYLFIAGVFLSGCREIADVSVEDVSAVPQTAASDRAAAWRDIDLKKYPDADTILLDDVESIVYNSDGTYERSDKSYTLIVTDAGRKKMRTVTLHFNDFYQSPPQFAVEIIKSDGRIVKPALQKNITIEADQMQSNIYDPAIKVFSVGIPDLEIGDIICMEYCQKTLRPRIKDVWCDIALLQFTDPVLHYKYTVSAPEKSPLRSIAVKDEVKGSLKKNVRNENGRIIYEFEVFNVPQIIPEPDMPPWYLHGMRVLCSTVPDWQSISRWYHDLCEEHLKAVSPELKDYTRKLVGSRQGKEAVRALFDFVSKEIRYTGVTNEKSAPGYEPHDVKDTFAQKHGVCRDKAALLVAMLREAGFDAFMVLFMAGDPKDEEIPNNYFNHAITGVKLSDGELLLMDPTDENSSDMLPAYAMNKSFLCATASGDILRRTPVVAPEKNMLTIRSSGVLDENYQLELKSELTFCGINDNIYRGAFARWNAEYRKQFVASALKKALPGANIKSVKILPEDVRDLSKEFKLVIECTVPEFADIKWGAGTLRMPFLSSSFGALNFMLEDKLLKSRKYPMQIFSTAGVDEKCTLQLPLSLKIAALPEFDDPNNALLQIKNSVVAKGRDLQFERLIKLGKVEVSVAEYASFRKAVQDLSNTDNKKVIIQRSFADKNIKFNSAQSVLEKSRICVDISSLSSYTVTCDQKIKVLDYGAVKQLSELKIPFMPGISEGRFIAGSVTASDGSRVPVNFADIKTMDSADAADAPRYPVGKNLIVPLPGVKVGSTIEYSWQLKFNDLPNSDYLYSLWRKMPVKDSVLEFKYPAKLEKKLNIVLPEVGFRCEKIRKNNIVSVKVYSSNIPMMPQEPGTPDAEFFAPFAGISLFNAINYGESLIRAVKKAAGNSPKAVELAGKLTANTTDVRDKVKIIRDYVAKNIRSAGPEINVLGVKRITNADITLQENYGNSVDRAVLCYAMLKAAGIENVALIAVSNMPSLEKTTRFFRKFPTNCFEEIMLIVKYGEQELYLNCNNEYSPLEYSRFAQKIALDPATGELFVPELAPGFSNNIRHDVYVKILPGGKGEFTVSTHYYGGAFAAMNTYLANITPTLEAQFWDKRLAGMAASGEIVSKERDFSAYPGLLKMVFTVDDLWQQSGEYISLTLPDFGFGDLVNTAGKRTLPYWFFPQSNMQINLAAVLPEDWRICELAGNRFEVGLPDAQGRVSQSFDFTPGYLTFERSRELQTAVYVGSQEYLLLEDLQKKLLNPANRAFLFKSIGK